MKVPPSPTLPFDEEEMAALFESCDRYPIKGIYNHGKPRLSGAPAGAPLTPTGAYSARSPALR